MASTYSALKIELLETGANSGTWGTATNVNLGDDILGEAITGSATVNFATDADVTITLTDSSTSQAARNLRLNITESSTGVGSVRNLILGSGCQIEKFYLINNTGTGAKTIKNTSGTGISVPAGKATLVYNNGTNVVDAASYFTSLTLGSALPVASGGTGTASPALVQGANVTITGTWPNQTIAAAAPGTGTVTSVSGTGTVNGISLSGTVTSSGSLTLGGALTGVNLSTQVTGTLPIANGGTGTTSTTFVNAATNVTGTLPVANGGTSLSTLTANNVVIGNGTSAPLFVAPSTSGNVLTSNGTTWASTAPSSLAAATQAQMVAASSNTVAATPLNNKYSPNACKLWIKCAPDGTISASYNVASTADFGTGAVRITIDTDFSTDHYAISAIAVWNGGNPVFCNINNNPEASKFEILSWQSFTVGNEPNFYLAACFGTLV